MKILTLTNLYIMRVCIEMHPFIHPAKELNRPEHNHHYIKANQVHNYGTRHATQWNHYIPSSITSKPGHTHILDYHTEKYTTIRDIKSKTMFKKTSKEQITGGKDAHSYKNTYISKQLQYKMYK
jgi:hypothetical protein